AKKNEANGYFELGYCYYYGCGIEEDNERAFKWHQLGAKNGSIIASYFLASCYKYGYGKENLFKAFELYKESAENGFIQSQYELASCYAFGKGIQENKIQALLYQENDGEYDVSESIRSTGM
ncbi:hypothetical protein C1645_668184, partial [Glomus cerebriforme]